jgi:hypothetical protein
MPYRPRRVIEVRLYSVLTSVLDGVSHEHPAPNDCPTGKSPDTDWKRPGGLRASLDGFFLERTPCSPHESNPGLSSPYRLALPTALSQPYVILIMASRFLTKETEKT